MIIAYSERSDDLIVPQERAEVTTKRLPLNSQFTLVFSGSVLIFISKRFDIFIIAYGFSKVSTRSVPFLSQFFLKKVSEKSHGENTVLIRYAPQKITAQFVTHLSVMIEFSRKMWYNVIELNLFHRRNILCASYATELK